MSLVNIDELTQEQSWGLAYAVKQENDGKPIEEQTTPQEYIDRVVRMACESYYKTLEEVKQRRAIEAVASWPAEQKDQLLKSLGVKDVL